MCIDTLLSDNRQEYVDSEPLWTLGFTRPLYIERQPTCLRCKELRRSSGRFVPVEPTIHSMPRPNLQKFAKLFGRYDDNIKARLSDQWPPSSRAPRSGCIIKSEDRDGSTVPPPDPEWRDTSSWEVSTILPAQARAILPPSDSVWSSVVSFSPFQHPIMLLC